MKFYRKFGVAMFVVFMILSMNYAAGQSTGYVWNTKIGTVYKYWIDDIGTTLTGNSTNLASVLPDSNRTTVVIFTNVTDNTVSYSSIATNGTVLTATNQTYKMSTMSLAGQSIVGPNGSLPLLLPKSVPSHSDYFAYLQSISNLLGGLLTQFLTNSVNTSIAIPSLSISSTNNNTMFVLSANVNLDKFNLGSLNLTTSNPTFAAFTGLNLTKVQAGVNVAYNKTDGGFQRLDFSLNSISNTYVSATKSYKLTPFGAWASFVRTQVIVPNITNAGFLGINVVTMISLGVLALAAPIIVRLRKSKI